MTDGIRDCLPPDRNPRKPAVQLPKGSIDTHVHVFEPRYPLRSRRGADNPPTSTLATSSTCMHLASTGVVSAAFHVTASTVQPS